MDPVCKGSNLFFFRLHPDRSGQIATTSGEMSLLILKALSWVGFRFFKLGSHTVDGRNPAPL